MPRKPRPIRAERNPAPDYPSLDEEWTRRGVSRRGFLAAALAGAAGAMTGCMGAAPRPSYPRGRWPERRYSFRLPLTLTGCAGAPEQATYRSILVTTPHRALVRRLDAPAGRAVMDGLTDRILATAQCHHSTLAAQVRRAEQSLHDAIRAWYQSATGEALPPRELLVRLKRRPPPPPPAPRAIATD